jgi:hypothetical protein
VPGPAGAEGAQGVKGDAGPVGPEGPQGIQGEQGIQGIPGLGIRFKGEVTSFEELPTDAVQGDLWVIGNRDDPSTPAQAYVWDETTQTWLDAGYIQGAQGVQGEQGVPGEVGPAGPEGPQGIQGVAGPTGADGPVGAKGDTGPEGPQGVPGLDSTVPGPVGPAGPTAVSADAGNVSVLGTDGLVFTPESEQLVTNVQRFGAVGDASTDDTAAVQAAIDAAGLLAKASMDAVEDGRAYPQGVMQFATVFFPAGQYTVSNLTVPSGVTLRGDSAVLQSKPGTTGYLITFTDGMWGGIRDLRVGGNATDDIGGVHVTPGRKYVSLEHCSVDFFRRRAVYVEGPAFHVSNSFLEGWRGDNSDLPDYQGVLEFATNANDAWLTNTEINGTRYHPDPSLSLGPTSSNLYACALVVRNCGNLMCHNVIFEQADTGVYVDNTAHNLFQGCRSEFNFGHGWLMAGGEGRLAECMAFDNSKQGDNLFDGFHFGTDTTNYLCTGLVSFSLNDTVKHRYGFYDAGTYASARNEFVNPRSYGDRQEFYTQTGPDYGGPRFTFPNTGGAVAITGATPNVSSRVWLRSDGATTITEFKGTVPGQMIYVLGNGTASVANNANITTLSGATTTLVNGVWYTFRKHDGVMRELDLSPRLMTNKLLRDPTITSATGETVATFGSAAGAVNHMRFVATGAGGGNPYIDVGASGDANVGLNVIVKGGGAFMVYSPTGTESKIQAAGPGDRNLALYSQGTGVVQAGGTQVEVKGHTHTVAQIAGAAGYTVTKPTSATSPGTQGTFATDSDWLYICVAQDTWRRVAIAVW